MTQRIMVIEDDDMLRDVYKELLTNAGYTVEAFERGTDGLVALEKNPYDLVLLDVILPDMNGLDALKQIKQNAAIRHIPVVLLTNLDTDMLVEKGMKLGAASWWVKVNYTPDQVVTAVQKIFAEKP